MDSSNRKIRVAVSSCLLGYDVRYDGTNRKNDNVVKLADTFDLMAICPEYGIGMGIPRDPVSIFNIDGQFRVHGVTNSQYDVTDALQKLAADIIRTHPNLGGYVFKARSPSCGLKSTPWYNIDGEVMGITSGIFSEKIQHLLPELPVIEESQLQSDNEVQAFIALVNGYARSKAKLD